MDARLYVILGSHACRTGILLMEHKRLPYRRVEVPTGLHPLAVRIAGYPGNRERVRRVSHRDRAGLILGDRLGTVPTLQVDGAWVSTNRAIARWLDRYQPDPPLFPSDPEQRAKVEEAERWGDEVLQMLARRIVLAEARRWRGSMWRDSADGRLGPLLYRSAALRLLLPRVFAITAFNASRKTEPGLLAQLPGALERVDRWIEEGVLDGERLNAADLMIAPSLALLTYRRDVRPQLGGRPLTALMDRVLPEPARA